MAKRKSAKAVSAQAQAPDPNKRLSDAIERKQYLEYLCFMMLRKLNETVGLESAVRSGVRRGEIEPEVFSEFFGGEGGENSGCADVGGYTVQGLLDAWYTATDNMMKIVAGRS